jgi:hypothetical protein
MAIDSDILRASAMHFVGHRKGRLLPDSVIKGADRQDTVGFYRGLTTLLFVVTLSSASATQPSITASVTQPTVTVSVTQPTITITEKNDIS